MKMKLSAITSCKGSFLCHRWEKYILLVAQLTGSISAIPSQGSRFLQQGVELQASESADQRSGFIRAEIENFIRIIKQTGIRAE